MRPSACGAQLANTCFATIRCSSPFDFDVEVTHGDRMVQRLDIDAARVTAEQHRTAGLAHDLGELHGQHARPALDENAARLEETGLRHGEERPRKVAGVVGIIGDRPADRALRRLVVAEEPLKHVRGRGAPVARERPQFERGARELAQSPFLAGLPELRHRVMDLLDRAEEARRAFAAPGEALTQRVMGGV